MYDDETPDATTPDAFTAVSTGDRVSTEDLDAAHSGSRARRAVTGVAIGLAVLTTGGVAIAASHTGTGTNQGGGPGGSVPGAGVGGGGFGGPPTGTRGATGIALRSTFVVPGTTKTATLTADPQRGTVSTVSATSISVSTSGLTKAWVIGARTGTDRGRDFPARPARGDSVLMVATGSAGTALNVQDDALSAAAGGGAGGTPPTT